MNKKEKGKGGNKTEKITFANFGWKTKAKWKTIKKLNKTQQEFVHELINEHDHYIIESPQNFDREAAYIYITETEEGEEHYIVRVSDNWSPAQKVDWDTDKEATMLKMIGERKLEVRYCKLGDFQPITGGKA